MMKEAYLCTGQEVLQNFRVQPELGLKSALVRARRDKFGTNDLPQARRHHPVWLLVRRLSDLLVMILVAAALVSIAFGRWGDAIVIGLAIVLDASMGLAQVWRTERVLEKLREQTQPFATVIRDGKNQQIPARELVVGDILELQAGERVGADARLISIRGLRAGEATLTGESDDVAKTPVRLDSRTPVSNRRNMVFLGTSIVTGSGVAVVVATGTQTELGKIAQVLKTAKSLPSPLARKLQSLGVRLGLGIVAAVALLAGAGLALGQSLVETALTSITLVVSAIPEDLSVILTIALTVGVTRILRNKGAVRELRSGETLGAATVICTDKTGTLTQGAMQAMNLDFLQGTSLTATAPVREAMHRLALMGLALASDAHRVSGESGKFSYAGSATERAALAFVEQSGLKQSELRQQWQQRDAIAFSPRWKYRASLHDHPTQATRYLFATGAPEVLLERSVKVLNKKGEVVELTSDRRWRVEKELTTNGRRGLRLMGVAVRRNIGKGDITHDDVNDLLFLGVLTIQDPVREDVKSVLRETAEAGIAVKLVTGDHAETARAVAQEVGIASEEEAEVLTSEDLQRMTDTELQDAVERVTIFARVTPLDKQRVVKALKACGHVVAMTGDGINDAVALKGADVGVAMGSGRDIAKEAADLVLLDDSFSTIVAAVREGRVIRDNLRKVIGFLLATNAAEVAIFFVSLLAGMPLPLLPAQILWVNLVTDGTSDIALSLEPGERGVMRRKPEDPESPLLGRQLSFHIMFAGAVMTAATIGVYWYSLEYLASDIVHARTMAFTSISIISLLSVWSFRSLRESIFKRGFWGNKWLPASLAVSAGLQISAIYVPGLQGFFGTVALSLSDWTLIVAVAVAALVVMDLRKLFIHNRRWTKDQPRQLAGEASK
ncbi:MAG: HAD-IC family P-type ATPase [bacterium]